MLQFQTSISEIYLISGMFEIKKRYLRYISVRNNNNNNYGIHSKSKNSSYLLSPSYIKATNGENMHNTLTRLLTYLLHKN